LSNISHPIFIGGSGSSGTTLVQTIINSHPNIFCGSELNLFNNALFYSYSFPMTESIFKQKLDVELILFRESLLRYGFSVDEICEFAATSQSFKEFCDKIIIHSLNSSSKALWAEKSPANCRYIDQILYTYPNAKYIHIVRDGRDVALSLEKRGWSYHHSVMRWIYDSMCGTQYRGREFYYEIRYEDLVSNQRKSITNLFYFLGLTVSVDDLLNNLSQSKSYNRFDSWTTIPSAGISDVAIYKWNYLSLSERRFLERIFRFTCLSERASKKLKLVNNMNGNEVLNYFGYDLNKSWDRKISIDAWVLYMYLKNLAGKIIKKNSNNRRWSIRLR